MKNFAHMVPTKVFFGEGQIENLPESVKEYGKNVLLVYGGGSIKKTGLYEEIINICEINAINLFELGGVEPNPRLATVIKGKELCLKHNIDVILAVGGGSVIDCSKVISVAINYNGDPWELLKDSSKITDALPLITILTIAATGSEMDPYAVIFNKDLGIKLSIAHNKLFPKVSILDPKYTYSLPKIQTAAGIADIMSHVFEEYFTIDNSAFIQDRISEGILKTCINYGDKLMENPEDYEARANIMWSSSLALNGLINDGKSNKWTVHRIENKINAMYDTTHGVVLGILTPYWLEYILDETTVNKIFEYGINVWGLDKNKDKFEVAKEAISKTREFFIKLGIPKNLKDIGVKEENLEELAKMTVSAGEIGGFKSLNEKNVLDILKNGF